MMIKLINYFNYRYYSYVIRSKTKTKFKSCSIKEERRENGHSHYDINSNVFSSYSYDIFRDGTSNMFSKKEK